MKAILQHHYGDASTLTFEDVARPRFGEEDVLVQVAAAGVGPAKPQSSLWSRTRPTSWRPVESKRSISGPDEAPVRIRAYRIIGSRAPRRQVHRGPKRRRGR